jgi:hypothetical protein
MWRHAERIRSRWEGDANRFSELERKRHGTQSNEAFGKQPFVRHPFPIAALSIVLEEGAIPMRTESALEQLNRLVGTWTTDATHPALPGVVVHGTAVIEWLEGERFLIHRARVDHSDFPDSISIVGITENDRVASPSNSSPTLATVSRLCMHYFDSRGIFRVFDMSIDDAGWRLSRNASGFSQRFTGTFADSGETVHGHWELCQDDVNWNHDLQITYRRRR